LAALHANKRRQPGATIMTVVSIPWPEKGMMVPMTIFDDG